MWARSTPKSSRSAASSGYAAGDLIGKGGLEWSYDRWIRGKDGVAKVEVDAMGRPKAKTAAPGGRLPQPGNSLVTTIDADVQEATEEALRSAIDLAHDTGSYGANGGAALVLDARNGEVISMASYPTYDPSVWVGGVSTKDYKQLTNKYANYPLLNRAIQSSKAVGSTFKAVTAVAALEEGIIDPGTGFYCPGYYLVPIDTNKTKFKCWSPGHGTLDLVGAMTQSCDVYFYNVGIPLLRACGCAAGRVGGTAWFRRDDGHRHPRRSQGACADSGVAPAALRE